MIIFTLACKDVVSRKQWLDTTFPVGENSPWNFEIAMEMGKMAGTSFSPAGYSDLSRQ